VIANWELSNGVDPASFTPAGLQNLTSLRGQRVIAAPEGFVLVNRYRERPKADLPFHNKGETVLVDSVMTGRVGLRRTPRPT
jgi:hypothetical protein